MILKQAETFAWRLAELEPPTPVASQPVPNANPLTRLHRGIALRRENMPSGLVAQLEGALGGKPDPSLGPNLLNHLSTKGLGEWWTPDPKSAERFAINPDPRNYTPGGKKADYQAVVSGDGDISSAESAMGKRYWRFKGGDGVNAQSIRVRRQHPDDWQEIPLGQ